MKKYLKIFLLLFCMLLSTIVASAHSGGTDSSGGHTNHSTGEYHYHHGYPAHQHPNGICPYKQSNTENYGNGSTGSGGSISGSNNSDDNSSAWVWFITGLAISSVCFVLLFINEKIKELPETLLGISNILLFIFVLITLSSLLALLF